MKITSFKSRINPITEGPYQLLPVWTLISGVIWVLGSRGQASTAPTNLGVGKGLNDGRTWQVSVCRCCSLCSSQRNQLLGRLRISSSPVSLTISPQTAAIGTGQSSQFTATVSRGTVTWTASAGTIDSTGNYTAPSGTQSMTATVTATSTKDSTKSASATVNVVAPGQVTATANVQVAAIPSAGSGRQCVRAVRHRYELRADDVDATGTHGRRGGKLVRRRNER